MTSNNPSINISVATKYLDPGERGAQVVILNCNSCELDVIEFDQNIIFVSPDRMSAWYWALSLLEAILTRIIGILRQGDKMRQIENSKNFRMLSVGAFEGLNACVIIVDEAKNSGTRLLRNRQRLWWTKGRCPRSTSSPVTTLLRTSAISLIGELSC